MFVGEGIQELLCKQIDKHTDTVENLIFLLQWSVLKTKSFVLQLGNFYSLLNTLCLKRNHFFHYVSKMVLIHFKKSVLKLVFCKPLSTFYSGVRDGMLLH